MARLALSFLNTFQATLDSQQITRFRSTNNQGLLVYLTLQAERPIPREVLATLFWPEESDSNARNNLRQSVYQLRKVLGDLKSPDAPYLQATRHTVQFNVDSDFTLDVNLFLQAIDSGDLETAVALYQGDLLPGFTCDSLQFEDWLRQEREQLHQIALEALFEVTQGYLQSGRFDQAQIDARRQLTLEPWRESAHRQLMRAFALAGDRSSAMIQFDACQDLLWEELGLQPAAETAMLYEEIKAGRSGAVASDETLLPPVKTNHNLPAATTPLIGRELELSQISGALTRDDWRLVTIVGPGGMGKTRLALAVGLQILEQYSDGVYFVDLAPLAQPEEISLAVAGVLDYQAPDSSKDIFPQLITTLSRRHLLLILDNFEHLLAGAALVNEMLQACPHLAILVTSRQRLNLASESRFELGGLDFPDSVTPEDALTYTAVRLFTDNGRRANSQFALTDDNGADVVRICRLVQGMPLGLVLAASWLELLTPAEIAEEIEESLDFLAAELADLPLRQRSMRAVFKRSWDMLTKVEQGVLANLSVFRGGFTREAAEQVAGANLRVLLALVNKSLLQRQADTGRLTMHELLRQFVGYRSRQGNDSDEVSLAHNRYFSQLVEQEIRRSLSLFPPYVPRRLAADTDNLHHAWTYAVDHGLTEDVSRMAPWIVALSFSQGIQPGSILAQVIQSLGQHEVSPTHRDLLHLRLIELDVLSGADYVLARRLLLEFVPLLEAQPDPELCYWANVRLAHIYNQASNPVALDWIEKAYIAANKIDDDIFLKMAEVNKFWIQVDLGLQGSSVLTNLQALLAYFEPEFPRSAIFNGILEALSLHCLAIEAYEQGIHYAKRNLNVAKGWQNLMAISHASDKLTDIYWKMGRFGMAGQQQLDVLDWHLAIGQVWQTLGLFWGIIASHPQIFGDGEAAVSFLSMVYHHPETIPIYQQGIEIDRPRFEEELGSDSFASAWERGKELDLDTAVAQMRAILAEGPH